MTPAQCDSSRLAGGPLSISIRARSSFREPNSDFASSTFCSQRSWKVFEEVW